MHSLPWELAVFREDGCLIVSSSIHSLNIFYGMPAVCQTPILGTGAELGELAKPLTLWAHVLVSELCAVMEKSRLL